MITDLLVPGRDFLAHFIEILSETIRELYKDRRNKSHHEVDGDEPDVDGHSE